MKSFGQFRSGEASSDSFNSLIYRDADGKHSYFLGDFNNEEDIKQETGYPAHQPPAGRTGIGNGTASPNSKDAQASKRAVTPVMVRNGISEDQNGEVRKYCTSM